MARRTFNDVKTADALCLESKNVTRGVDTMFQAFGQLVLFHALAAYHTQFLSEGVAPSLQFNDFLRDITRGRYVLRVNAAMCKALA